MGRTRQYDIGFNVPERFVMVELPPGVKLSQFGAEKLEFYRARNAENIEDQLPRDNPPDSGVIVLDGLDRYLIGRMYSDTTLLLGRDDAWA